MLFLLKKILKKPSILILYFSLCMVYIRPRFKRGSFSIFGKKFTYIDSTSFVFMYLDIFLRELYKFKSSSQSPLIIDCGSNIGLSVIYFKYLYPKAIIKAFEPDPKVFSVLYENCKKFNLDNTEIINKGVWTSDSTMMFLPDGSDGGKMLDSQNDPRLIKVEMIRLKNLLELENKIDFLKIDIEGAEHDVLLDCREHLLKVEFLFVEYHSVEKKDQKLGDVLNILKGAGFRCYVNNVGRAPINYFLKKHSQNGFDLQLNIYAVKE